MRNEYERLPDDLDLFQLFHELWKQKILILSCFSLALISAVLYVTLVNPTYEAKLYTLPPSQNEIEQLNYGRGGDSGLSYLTTKDVYESFLKNLQSEAVRNNFFKSVYLPSLSESQRSETRDALYQEFTRKLTVSVAAKDMPIRYAITVQASDPIVTVKWASAYTEMAAERAKREVLNSVRSESTLIANNLEQQIVSAQASARKQRSDQIAQLKEALVVANSIGLEKPPMITGAVTSEASAAMNGALTYMRGSKALEAEIKNLESRESDDPFIRNLRSKQQKISFYRNLRIDPSVVSVYQQDGAVEQPDKPIQPKKALIVGLSAVLGLGLGGALAIGRITLQRQRKTSLTVG
ncbi:Wzz/FepE/Etk N-terminal domain-containing protein [Pseudomonas asiatica]|uniref:Wzz/FepE/Etk N-terminal domain-containing protein n=1 Tax=Pseudomonas asiatica TaxID=2219225 RepID=UPI0025701CA8|nr:Wzz/FepE/Etk N-terminal domain-containing protein [Pseudomonas asiatica]WJD71545.1 Wzz/FepE/Etk N-terminal domain-containing protein [Pseudomonas asiatica]